MKIFHPKFLLVLFAVVFFSASHAQLSVNTGVNAAQVVAGFMGSGLTVSNINLNCPAGAYGTFSNGNTTNLGITTGSIFTSGCAVGAIGPNNSASYSCEFDPNPFLYYTYNDPNLTTIEPNAQYDACILTFDVIPSCSTLTIRFVFGSEEYPEYVNASFNDAFGFFITGPNPSGPAYSGYNVARLPNLTPVSIDNVNAGNNAAYYVNNAGGATIQYDGFTTVITSNLAVVPCSTYTFKIAIADAGDDVFDSGVFIDFLSCSTGITASTSSTATCGCSGTATVNPSGGNPPYTYVWNTIPAQNTQTAVGLCPGNYVCTVYDQSGCVSQSNSFSVNVGSLAGGTPSIQSQVNVSCNGGNNGSATATISGGTPNYTYSWNTSPVQNTQTATGLSAGTYNVTITDASGCVTSTSVTIAEPSALSSSASSTPAGCGVSNGTATANPSGGTPGYTYLWNNGQVTQTATGLSAGTYNVTVTDANGCTTTASVSISTSSGPSVTTSVTQANCGNANGTATANPSGGTPGYTYSWNSTPPQNTQTANNLTAGTYVVTVTDANGCATTSTVTINSTAPPSANTSAVQPSCGSSNGSASANPNGGTAPYTYIWSTGDTTSSISNLAPGNYSVTVTDASCSVSGIELVTNGNFSAGNTGFTSTYLYNPPPNGGEGEYWVAAGSQVSGWNPGMFSNGDNTTGTGDFMIVNGSGTPNSDVWCQTIPVTANTTYNFSTWVSSLNNSSPAALQFSINGFPLGPIFNAPATWGSWSQFFSVWNSGANTSATICIVNQNTTLGGNDFGLDDISFQSCSPCTATAVVTINASSSPTVTATTVQATCGASNGSATANPTGGTPGYTYSWSNGDSNQTTNNLSAGTYIVTVTDAAGCSDTASVNITSAAGPAVTSSSTNVLCNGGSTGSATANPSGGTPNYTYSWSTSPVQNTQTANNLPAGTYSVIVSDANGCTSTSSVTIIEPAMLSLSVSPTNNICNGGNAGSASASVSGGTPNYTYSWSNGQTTQTATGLAAGNYIVTIMDANGCNLTQNVTIGQPAALLATVTSTNAICNGGNSGTATVNPTGGTPNYTFSWNTVPVQNTQTANNLPAGNYQCTVTDANGCTNVVSATISEPLPVSLSISCNDSICSGDTVTLAATASGGTPNYTFIWLPGPFVGSSISVAPSSNSSYTVSVSDVSGCTTASQSCTVIVLPAPVALFDTISNGTYSSVYSFNDLSTGGTAWSWNFGDNSAGSTSQNPSHTFPGAGSYTVTQVVFNQYGCPDTFKIIVVVDEGVIIPNVFTPDADGTNDVWFIPNSGMKNFKVEIFDRWGLKVWETEADEIRWDGRSFSGKLLVDGTYYFVLDARLKTSLGGEKSIRRNGYVTLLTKNQK